MIKRLNLSVWFLLLFVLHGASGARAEFKITGDSPYAPFKPIILKAEGVDPSAVLIWSVDREDEVGLVEIEQTVEKTVDKDGKESLRQLTPPYLHVWAPAGTYRLTGIQITQSGGRLVKQSTRFTFTVTGGKPIPPIPPVPPDPPIPPPTPPTPPSPVGGKNLWILVIEETQEAAAGRSLMFANKEIRDRVKAGGHRWRIVDKDVVTATKTVPADLAPWFDRARGKALPYYFLINSGGEVVNEGPMPSRATEFSAVLARYGTAR